MNKEQVKTVQRIVDGVDGEVHVKLHTSTGRGGESAPMHVLLRDDLEPGFDEDEALAEMAKMVEEAGDWRNHIPYEAIRNYNQDEKLREMYSHHVDECVYCQRCIKAFSRN